MTTVSKPDVKPEEPEPYHPYSVVNEAVKDASVNAFFGLVFSAMQNAITDHKAGALGVFRRTGGTIALFSAMGGTYGAGMAYAANLQGRDDWLSGAVGGCAAGLVGGAAVRSVPMMFGTCATLAGLIGTFDKAGRSIAGAYGRGGVGNSPHSHGLAMEGAQPGQEYAGVGETGWSQEHQRRRLSFFKPRQQERPDASSE